MNSEERDEVVAVMLAERAWEAQVLEAARAVRKAATRLERLRLAQSREQRNLDKAENAHGTARARLQLHQLVEPVKAAGSALAETNGKLTELAEKGP